MTAQTTLSNGLALDARSLDGLRRDAARDPKAAARTAAGQFESLFMQQLLKSMRDAMPKSGMFQGPAHDTYVSMLDQQLAQSVSNRPGGLADMIANQLTRHLEGAKAAAAGGAGATGGAGAGQIDPTIVRGAFPRPVPMTSGKFAAMRLGLSLHQAALKKVEQPEPSLDAAAATALQASLAKRLDGPQADFVGRMWPHAISAQRQTGVPAAFVVGQAALESGWGRREIKHPDGRSAHNLFGIKAGSSWTGQTVDVTTTEYIDGKPVKMVDRFRAYGSYAEAFRDWAQLMGRHDRYAQVLRAGHSVEGFAQGMQRAGYATDPRYADKLENTINQTLVLRRLTV